MAVKTIYHFLLLTGGSATALDSVDGNSLLDKDRAFVLYNNALFVYELDADSGAAELSPGVISPDTNAGTKRWILVGTRYYIDSDLVYTDLGTGFSLGGGTTPTALVIPLNATLPGQDTGPAAPTTGTWPRGWIRWNTEPVAGGNAFWICVTAGTSGTWKEGGLING